MTTAIAILITVTWYDGPGPNTACGQPFDIDTIAAAAPLAGPVAFDCGDVVTLCTDNRCADVLIWDRIPKHSSDLYDGLVLDLTPAAIEALGIPHGFDDGVAYGRGEVTLYDGIEERWR